MPDPTAVHNENTAIKTSRAEGSFKPFELSAAKINANTPVPIPWKIASRGTSERIPMNRFERPWFQSASAKFPTQNIFRSFWRD